MHSKSIELPKLVLASASPRRAEILRTVGWPFVTRPVQIDESRREGEDAASYVRRLAAEKAETVTQYDNAIIVGADTTVVVDGHILEKPVDREDAGRMLRLLSDRWHQVLTGVAVVRAGKAETLVAHETTEVKFARMNEADIDWYLGTNEPMDKAGAYAIQGLGARFIEGIRGDFFNVVGLPVRLLFEMIRRPDE